MTHPHHDRAQAALHSLRAALAALNVQRVIVQREQGLALVEDADGLRSQTYGGRRGAGGRPGDPTAAAAINGTAESTSSQRLTARVEQLAASVTHTLQWLTGKLGLTGAGDPLDQLAAAVPDLSPSTAQQLALWVGGEDYRIRRALSIGPDRQPLPGVACPSCGVRQLYVQTSAPAEQRTIICAAGCRCAGDACPCGMPVRAADVAHIWAVGSELVAGVAQRTAA